MCITNIIIATMAVLLLIVIFVAFWSVFLWRRARKFNTDLAIKIIELRKQGKEDIQCARIRAYYEGRQEMLDFCCKWLTEKLTKPRQAYQFRQKGPISYQYMSSISWSNIEKELREAVEENQ